MGPRGRAPAWTGGWLGGSRKARRVNLCSSRILSFLCVIGLLGATAAQGQLSPPVAGQGEDEPTIGAASTESASSVPQVVPFEPAMLDPVSPPGSQAATANEGRAEETR